MLRRLRQVEYSVYGRLVASSAVLRAHPSKNEANAKKTRIWTGMSLPAIKQR